MSYEIIGVEIGVLLSPNHEEFKDYSCVNKNLPFGFFDEDQFSLGYDKFDDIKKYVIDYVKNGVEKTYGIISKQEPFMGISMDDFDKIGSPLNYDYFKDKDFILYSIAKINGELVEGFLEKALHELEEQNKVIAAIEAIAHEVVKEHDWTMPQYIPENYDNYDEYENECLDIGHEYRADICKIVRERLIKAGKLVADDMSYGDILEETVWDEITTWICANQDKDLSSLENVLSDAQPRSEETISNKNKEVELVKE